MSDKNPPAAGGPSDEAIIPSASEFVIPSGKEFDDLALTFDPAYRDIMRAIDIVRKYIIEHKLIIYGGLAIDYALRLVGDQIYLDNATAIPDFDVFSPNNVTDSYALADLLYAAGWPEARAINALHMETMKVDIVSNHWVIDLTYRPKGIYERLPYLEYMGMRVIHPDFQRIDVHSSLAFPYDSPPREVIFDRWKKDITRFNKLAAAYPLESDMRAEVAATLVTADGVFSQYVLAGFAAYAAIYQQFVVEMAALDAQIPDGIVPARFSATFGAEHIDSIEFDSPGGDIEIVHFDIKKAAGRIGASKPITYYEPYINLIPARAELPGCTIYSTEGRLVAISSFDAGESRLKRIRMVGVQYQLKYFLSMHHAATMGYSMSASSIHGSIYLNRYVSLLRMISAVEAASGRPGSATKFGPDSVFFPSVNTYGAENVSLSRLIALSRVESDLTGKPSHRLPQNYYPGRAAARKRDPPAFSPDEIIFFQESGNVIPEGGTNLDPSGADEKMPTGEPD